MGDEVRSRSRESIVQEAFARQARGFARSPLQTDPRRLQRLIEFVGARPGERALDAACGPGIVMAALRRAGLTAVGIDLTLAMLREAAPGGGSLVQGDTGRLPFRESAFDVVVCRNSLHHVSDASAAIREMARVLRPRGRLVVEDMRAPDDEAKRACHETLESLRDVSHARTLTRGDLRSMAAAAGLADFEELPITLNIDFDEWIDRAYPPPDRREQARLMLEACLERDLCGLRVWKEGDRLKFERQSLLFKGARTA
jgi:ubiquinone/menaquinone biosynthesis C-methylase UbiE